MKSWRQAPLHALCVLIAISVAAVCAKGGEPELGDSTREPNQTDKPQHGPLQVPSLQKRIEALKNASGETDDAKLPAIKRLEEALQTLAERDAFEASTKRYTDLAASAPSRGEELKAQRDGPANVSIPPAPNDPSLALTTAYVATLRELLTEKTESARTVDEEIKTRITRRQALPGDMAEARRELASLESGSQAEADGAPAESSPEEAIFKQGRVEMLKAKIASLRAEAKLYEAESEILPLRLDLLKRQVLAIQEQEKRWADRLAKQRLLDATADREAAREATQEAARLDPSLEAYARRTQAIAEGRSGPEGYTGQMNEAANALKSIQALSDRLQGRFDRLRRRIDAMGLTRFTARELMRERGELRIESLHEPGTSLRKRIHDVQKHYFAMQDDRARIAVPEETAKRLVATMKPEPTGDERIQALALAEQLVTQRRDLLDASLRDADQLMAQLIRIRTEQEVFRQRVAEFRNYVEMKSLWAPNAGPLRWELVGAAVDGVRWLSSPTRWIELMAQAASDLRGRVYMVLAWLAGAACIAWCRRAEPGCRERLRQRLLTHKASTALHAFYLLLAFASCMLTPYLMVGVGLHFTWARETNPLGIAVGTALTSTAIAMLIVGHMVALSRADGLLCMLSPQRREANAYLHRCLRALRWPFLSGVFLASTFAAQPNILWQEAISRFGIILMVGGYLLFFAYLLSRRRPWIDQFSWVHEGWGYGAYRILQALVLLVPVIALVLALLGYSYAARHVTNSLVMSVMFGFWILLINSYCLRWILSGASASAPSDAAEKGKDDQVVCTGGGLARAEDAGRIRMDRIQQRRKLTHVLQFLIVVALLAWAWGPLVPVLSTLDTVGLYTVRDALEGPRAITLADAAGALLCLMGMALILPILPVLYDLLVFRWGRWDSGLQYAILTLSRYAVLAVGIVCALMYMGSTWQRMQWLIAALSVGLGFGLQEIFSNLVSGLLILLERSIRPGDIVSVGDVTGEVKSIQIRATKILQWDRKELIVPNKEFITGQVVNWSLSDRLLRLHFAIGVAYGSDTEKVQAVLLQVAASHANVLHTPKPYVLFKGFGDSTLDFELRLYIENDERGFMVSVRHEINLAIDKAFREADIEIAFPQQDLHIRSWSSPPVAATEQV